MIRELFKKRSLEKYRLMDKYWTIAIDGTQLYSFTERHCKHCLKKEYKNKETGEVERTVYYHTVLEAKLIVGNMALSILTEFIENENESVSKQDCEVEAAKRLLRKLKFKCNKDIEDFINDISYRDGIVNITEFKEIKIKRENCLEKESVTEFLFITNIRITKKNNAFIIEAGRSRWKIENEGFNNQKNIRYDIEHVCCENYTAMKNHYLIVQISDILRQLLECGSEAIKKLNAGIKEISSRLLESFRRDP